MYFQNKLTVYVQGLNVFIFKLVPKKISVAQIVRFVP